MCKCPEARAWALPYMATALAIPSRDLDRGSALSLQLNGLLFVFVCGGYQVPISVVLIGTKPVNYYSRTVRRDTNADTNAQTQYKPTPWDFALGLPFPRPPFCSDLA